MNLHKGEIHSRVSVIKKRMSSKRRAAGRLFGDININCDILPTSQIEHDCPSSNAQADDENSL